MKKMFYILMAAVLMVSCDKSFYDEWSGTYSYGDMAGYDYMYAVAGSLIVDNIKEMETAIYVEANSPGSRSARFNRVGSIWDAGSRWTVTAKSAVLSGLLIEKAAADSTWTLTRNGKYPFMAGYNRDEDGLNYGTSYKMKVKMLKDTSSFASPDHYWWEVSLKECSRSEDGGYRAEFTTPDAAPLVYSYGSFCSWSRCKGILGMQVFKDEEVIDVARMQFGGGSHDIIYVRGL